MKEQGSFGSRDEIREQWRSFADTELLPAQVGGEDSVFSFVVWLCEEEGSDKS